MAAVLKKRALAEYSQTIQVVRTQKFIGYVFKSDIVGKCLSTPNKKTTSC